MFLSCQNPFLKTNTIESPRTAMVLGPVFPEVLGTVALDS